MMHIEGPWLTSIGKKKSKQKFRNAEAKRQYENLQREWEELKKRHGGQDERKHKSSRPRETLSAYTLSPPAGRETKHIPSLGTGMGVAPPARSMQYTGTKMLGVSQMHKSNIVPVFQEEDIEAIARMRR